MQFFATTGAERREFRGLSASARSCRADGAAFRKSRRLSALDGSWRVPLRVWEHRSAPILIGARRKQRNHRPALSRIVRGPCVGQALRRRPMQPQRVRAQRGQGRDFEGLASYTDSVTVRGHANSHDFAMHDPSIHDRTLLRPRMSRTYRFTFGPWNISTGADPFGPPVRLTYRCRELREYKKSASTNSTSR